MPLGTLHIGHLAARMRMTYTATGWREASAEDIKPGKVKITRGPSKSKPKKASKKALKPRRVSVEDLATETTQFIVYAIEYLVKASEEIEAEDYSNAFESVHYAITAIMASRTTMETVIEQGSLHGFGGGIEAKALKLISQAVGVLVEVSKAINAGRYSTALELIGEAETMVKTGLKYVTELK